MKYIFALVPYLAVNRINQFRQFRFELRIFDDVKLIVDNHGELAQILGNHILADLLVLFRIFLFFSRYEIEDLIFCAEVNDRLRQGLLKCIADDHLPGTRFVQMMDADQDPPVRMIGYFATLCDEHIGHLLNTCLLVCGESSLRRKVIDLQRNAFLRK